jgi:hypothetical protein
MCHRDNAIVAKEAVWALANLASGGSAAQAQYAIQQGLLQGLALATPKFNSDDRTLKVCIGTGF